MQKNILGLLTFLSTFLFFACFNFSSVHAARLDSLMSSGTFNHKVITYKFTFSAKKYPWYYKAFKQGIKDWDKKTKLTFKKVHENADIELRLARDYKVNQGDGTVGIASYAPSFDYMHTNNGSAAYLLTDPNNFNFYCGMDGITKSKKNISHERNQIFTADILSSGEHEIGHALGLDHSYGYSIMNSFTQNYSIEISKQDVRSINYYYANKPKYEPNYTPRIADSSNMLTNHMYDWGPKYYNKSIYQEP